VVNGQPLEGDGYATYRLTVLLEPAALPEQSMAMKMPPPVNAAHRLYVNGQLVGSAGQVGPTKETTVPQLSPYVTAFTPTGPHTEIVLQISNFHHYQGGILFDTIVLGSQTQVQRLDEQNLGRNLFLAGSIFIMGLYHLGLFSLRRREKSALFFGLLCLTVAGTTLIADQPQIFAYYFSESWAVFIRTRMASATTGMVTLILFVYTLFPHENPKWGLRSMVGLGLLLATLPLLLPITPVTALIQPIAIFGVLVALYVLGVMFMAVSRRRDGAIIFLLGFVPLLLAIGNDILYFSGFLETGQAVSIGLFVFIFAQAYLLSARFSEAFTQTEQLSGELQRNNQSLQQTQEALRRSEEKYRAIFEDSRDVIFITGVDGRIEDVNSACQELFGYTRSEAQLMNALEFYAIPDDRHRYRELIERDGSVTDFELQMRHRDGHLLDCQITATLRRDPAGQVIGYQGIIHDITALKQTEAQRVRTLSLQKEKEAAESANQAKSAFLASMSHELRTPLNAILGFSRLMARSPNLNAKEQDNMAVIINSGQHLLRLINQVLDLSKIEAGRMTYDPDKLNLPGLLTELEAMFRLLAEEKRAAAGG
jgi:PAS domain S-box-containing protein